VARKGKSLATSEVRAEYATDDGNRGAKPVTVTAEYDISAQGMAEGKVRSERDIKEAHATSVRKK
jgi:hypothetical protein